MGTEQSQMPLEQLMVRDVHQEQVPDLHKGPNPEADNKKIICMHATQGPVQFAVAFGFSIMW